MFAQHMVASLNSKGKMATVMPHGVLFRGGDEKKIRAGMAKDNIIEAIIGLPAGLFYGTGIPACILVINKDKPEEMRGEILFINGDAEYAEGKNQNRLRPEDIEKIIHIYRNYMEIPGYSRMVKLEEVEEQDFNFNIRRYVDNSPNPESHDVHSHLMGGIPKNELDAKSQLLDRYGLNDGVLLEKMSEDYLAFKSDIDGKDEIKETIEAALSVTSVEDEMRARLAVWWDENLSRIEGLSDTKYLYNVHREFILSIKKSLLPMGLLDEFKVAGIFVNWWNDVQYTLKRMVAGDDADGNMLDGLKSDIEEHLEQYLTESRQYVISIFENWWDKYSVTAREIEEERDRAKARLMAFWMSWGMLNECEGVVYY